MPSGLVSVFFQGGYLKETIQRYENTYPPCPKMNECPLQRDHFERKVHLSDHQLSGDMLVFSGGTMSQGLLESGIITLPNPATHY